MFDERQPEKFELSAELAALERQLANMTPAVPRIDRDRLMFEAGQAAVGKRVAGPSRDGRAMYDGDGRLIHIAGPSWAVSRFWPAAAAMMTAATVLLATMLVWQRHATMIAQQAKPLLGRELGAERQAAVTPVANAPREQLEHPSDRLATNLDERSTIPRATSGYLGVRYIALTRGVGALEPVFQSVSGNGDSSIDIQQSQPATARGLLDELLPTSTRAAHPRS